MRKNPYKPSSLFFSMCLSIQPCLSMRLPILPCRMGSQAKEVISRQRFYFSNISKVKLCLCSVSVHCVAIEYTVILEVRNLFFTCLTIIFCNIFL